MRYFCTFYVSYPYYFPHFLPISEELAKRGYQVHYVLSDKQNSALMQEIAESHGLDFSFGEERLFEIKSEFMVFANPYERAPELDAKTLFLEHGIGTKSAGFFPIIEYIDIYLVEGSYKYERLLELYPAHKEKLKVVGFSKFDAIVNLNDAQKYGLYKKYGLDPAKKTILYAPTFFPSSIEKMDDDFPDDFKECNIIIKAHYLSYERGRYKKQREKLSHWGSFANCCVVGVEEYSLVPLFAIADVMISDESSAMFEFASLNKPVISNRYFKLRWSYYLLPWKLKKRIDHKKDKYRMILENADSYHDTLKLTKEALANPHKLEDKREAFAEEICGQLDGKVSSRIVDIMEENRG